MSEDKPLFQPVLRLINRITLRIPCQCHKIFAIFSRKHRAPNEKAFLDEMQIKL